MNKKRVLIGGEPDFLATAQDFYSNSDKFSVVIAEDGEAILAMLAEKPDLAIVDIDLPTRGGDECCRTAKEKGLSPETLIALAVSTEEGLDVGRCIDAGCDVILPKPLQYERLAGITTRFLFKGRHLPYRFPVRLTVSYGIHPEQLTEKYSTNLTTMGLFLETGKVKPVGTLLHLVFNLPGGDEAVQCTARVAWLNNPVLRRDPLLPAGMGLQFLEMDPGQVTAIEEFLYCLAAA